jgi:hypothetical protein
VRIAVAVALLSLLALPPVAGAAKPKPRTGSSVVVERASGTVLVKRRGSRRAVRLGPARAIPVGSTVDATNGRVRLTSTADRSGRKLQSALFRDGAFVVTQKRARRPLTELRLAGGDFQGCAAERRRTGVFASRSARRRLWGTGKGRFRTRGRNGSATVRGTTWLTEDGCDGTMALARQGEVTAESRDLSYELVEPNESVIFYCNTDGIPGVSQLYCLGVLSRPAMNVYGFGIATYGTPDDQYELCVTEPNGADTCGPFPFAPEQNGIKAAGVGCLPAQIGTHVVRWRLHGVDLPVPLTFDSNAASDQSFCVSQPPRPGIDPPATASGLKRHAARAAARAGHQPPT